MKQNTSFSILSLLSLLVGLIILILANPNASQELENLPLTAFNLDGINLHMPTVFFIYVLPGLCIVIFAINLFRSKMENFVLGKISKTAILFSGCLWILFGLMSYSPFTENQYSKIVLLTLVFLVLIFCILLFFGISLNFICKKKTPFYITLAAFAIVFIMTFLSLFVFDDITWIRTNLSILVFFIWLVPLGYWFDKVM